MASRSVFSFVLLLCLKSCKGDSDYSTPGLSMHIDTMLAEYDRDVPPEDKVIVTMAIDLRHTFLDDDIASMRILADMTLSWRDNRLTWNATTWAGESVLVSSDRLWYPDISLINAAANSLTADGGAPRVRITSDGGLASVTRMDISVPVSLQLEDWPCDKHEAIFKFGSREHSADELDIEIEKFLKAKMVENGAWVSDEITGELSTWVRGDGSKAAVVLARVTAARRGTALAAAASAVFLGAQLILLATAARPCAARPPLAASAAFVTVVWLVAVLFHLPAAGTVPRVVRVVCALSVLCAACGATAALTARLARRSAPPSALLRGLLTRVSMFYSITPDKETNGECGAWVAAARLLDAVLITMQIITQFVLVIVYYV